MKRFISTLLAITILSSMLLTSAHAIDYKPTVEDQAYPIAQALNEAGLFNGTGTKENDKPEFDLGGTASRAQAIVMLVRILGKEAEAKEAPASPFTDVPDWAKPHVNYAYAHGLTSGTSATTFGSNTNITNTEYLTLCLRALGYNDDDFQWDKAYIFAQELGLIEEGEYEERNAAFKRADVVLITYSVMNAPMKDSDQTLAQNQGITLKEVSRGILPLIVAEKTNVLYPDSPDFPWGKNQFGEPMVSMTYIGDGTLFRGGRFAYDYSLSCEGNVRRLNKSLESMDGNVEAYLHGERDENYGSSYIRVANDKDNVSWRKQDDGVFKYSVSIRFGSNWEDTEGSSGALRNRSHTYRARRNLWLNAIAYLSDAPVMAQQVYTMIYDYYESLDSRTTSYREDGGYGKVIRTWTGYTGPISQEMASKYGLTILSDEGGESYGRTMVVTNGEDTWTVGYYAAGMGNVGFATVYVEFDAPTQD